MSPFPKKFKCEDCQQTVLTLEKPLTCAKCGSTHVHEVVGD